MSYNPQDREFLIEVEKGNVPGHSIINKFGFDSAVTSTLQAIADAQVYQTPTAAVSLEILSSDANDAAAGTGARTVEIQGLDANFAEQTQTVTMNGTTAAAITGTWMRVFRARVTESGTYASQSAGSHAGTLTVRVAGAGATWATIGLTTASFPMGQTEIGAYTIPAGKTGYLLSKHISIESTKTPNVLWFRRENADDTSAPYDSMRLFQRHVGAAAEISYSPHAPVLVLPEKTDIGCMGYVATGTAAVSVDFQILLVDN
jgi:hypothetical protein